MRIAFVVSVLAACFQVGQAAEDDPVVHFDAAVHASPAEARWVAASDRTHQASGKSVGAGESLAWRIADDDAEGDEDLFYQAPLTGVQREAARRQGFVYRWRLRIPEETGGPTRAIGSEVCIADRDGSQRLRFGLQMGREASDLTAALMAGQRGRVEGSVVVGDPAGFHEWSMLFDGTTRILNVAVDDQLLLSTSFDHQDTGHHLVFGSRSTGIGTGDWQRVEFSIGLPEHCKLVPPPEPPFQTDVFVGGQGGYHAYRIPALIVAPGGDVLVFCEARKTNLSDDGDIDLLLRRSEDGGITWLPPQLIVEEGGDARIKFGNPTPVLDQETGTIWLAVNRDYLDERGARQGGSLVLLSSDDDGRSWSKPVDITAHVKNPGWKHYAFGPGIGIQLREGPHKGRLILPANFRESFTKSRPSWSHIIFSDDHGRCWQLGGRLGDYTNECQVVEIMEDGRPGLLLNARNHWGRAGVAERAGKRLVARSFDGGRVWSKERMDAALSDPPCQASLFRYRGQTTNALSRILFANPAGPGRARLTIRVSSDEGHTWPVKRVLYSGSAAYSCIARLPDGKIGVIFERDGYRKLTFTSFPLDLLMPRKAPTGSAAE